MIFPSRGKGERCDMYAWSKRPRWWTDTGIRCAVVVVMSLALPPCMGSEDNVPVSYYWAEVNYTYRDPETNKLMNETAEGKYGVESLVDQRIGLVMHVHDKANKSSSLGCTDYTNTIPQVPWIALIERGVCPFAAKIKVATQTYNATAVVIYNNEVDGITIMTNVVKTQVSIFVSHKTGQRLVKLADSRVLVDMTIIPGRKETVPDDSSNSISNTSVLFVSISFIVLMIISLAWLIFYYIQRFRYAHAKERLARRLTSAAKKAISKIPQKMVKNGDQELDTEFDQCAVCIEGYKAHDVIRILPCKHVFHKSCVDPWLLDQRSCPMCKLDILRAYGMQVVGSQDSVHQDVEGGGVGVGVGGEDEGEASTATEDQAVGDTEVKVLLLPHTCLHLHWDQDTSPPAGPSSPPDTTHTAVSAESPTLLSSLQHCEMQSLITHPHHTHHQEDQEEEDRVDQIRQTSAHKDVTDTVTDRNMST